MNTREAIQTTEAGGGHLQVTLAGNDTLAGKYTTFKLAAWSIK